jgi:hypothetical protein
LTFGYDTSFNLGERIVHGVLESGHGRVAALGHLLVLYLPEERLDVVQFGTVRWQVEQVDAMPPEVGQGSLDEGVLMERAVVQDDHPQDRQDRQRAEEAKELLRLETPGLGYPVDSWSRACFVEGGQGVEATALGVQVGDFLPFSLPNPTVGDRLRGAEAALVQVGED